MPAFTVVLDQVKSPFGPFITRDSAQAWATAELRKRHGAGEILNADTGGVVDRLQYRGGPFESVQVDAKA